MSADGKRDRVLLSFDMVEKSANGGKPPIILLHGIMSSKESWQNVIHPIAEATRRKVYAYDARNHGDSGWSDIFDYDPMVEDLLQFMDCIHSQKAVLVGHSLGGTIAMLFATKWPERVETLICEDISPKSVPLQVLEDYAKYIQVLRDIIERIPSDIKDLQEAQNFIYDFLRRHQSQEDQDSGRRIKRRYNLPLREENGRFKWKANLKILEKFLLTLRRRDVTGLFSGPTLILYGTKSFLKVSGDRDYIKRIFPAAQLRAIEDATHQVHADQGDVFVTEVADFINES